GTGTLKVNNVLALAFNTGTGLGVPFGALNVRGGAAALNSVVAGVPALVAGVPTSVITLSNATFVLTNRLGSPSAPLGALALTNSLLRLRVNGAAPITNIAASTLSAGGVTTIQIDSVSSVVTTTTFPVISYSTFNGSIANFAVGALPPNFAGNVV